ncbi:ribosomal RNA-processing protein 7 homolog A [Venturia canescens]|uniref:ribosomal RNA-processing protein 7 homolog A n=1 Tax=Venturia canescens TaxID=32260 RepID=UPI001C9C5542|nr:ribosomal RNA-processing protein 7 homolog A [Venturia canescens]
MVVELKGGFRTLWLRFDSTCSAPHQLFFKEHSVRNQEPEYPRGRTLFILNVPPWASCESLKETFAKLCGPVTSQKLSSDKLVHSKQDFGKIYIVFERESSLDKALAIPPHTTLTLYEGDKEPNTVGLTYWFKEYNRTVRQGEASMKRDIEKYMRAYDKRVAESLANGGNVEEVDQDGWVKVTSKKKRGQFAPARKESTISKLQKKEEGKNRKKELLNFYTFQIRESKKQHIVELRKKFELDKKKLEQLKTKRTFKPF